MEDITDTDYAHAKRVQIDLYVQADTLLLPNILANFQNMCLEIYELDPASFLTAQG